MTKFNKASMPARLLIEIYGWVVAAGLLVIFESARLTCRFEIEGEEYLKQNPHAIWACWHEFVVCAFVALPRLKKLSNHQVWLNHPAWIMRPIHRIMAYYGVDVVMGASGERGREAAGELLERIRKGESTSINPDGPAGPKHELKKGVLILAREAKIPVLAFHYHASRHWIWPGWDKKIVPMPFSKFKIRISEPIFVSDDKDEAQNKISRMLS